MFLPTLESPLQSLEGFLGSQASSDTGLTALSVSDPLAQVQSFESKDTAPGREEFVGEPPMRRQRVEAETQFRTEDNYS